MSYFIVDASIIATHVNVHELCISGKIAFHDNKIYFMYRYLILIGRKVYLYSY